MTKTQKRPGRKYPRRKYWIQQRDAVFVRAGHYCEVSGASLAGRVIQFVDDQPITKWARAAHHIIAERYARRWVPGCDPHCLGNLVVITPSLHARVTAAEKRLSRVDIIGYRQELNRLGFPADMFDKALTALCASVKK